MPSVPGSPNPDPTMWHEIFAGSNFCDFSSDPQKYVPANKNYRKHFSGKNLLHSKYSLTKIRYTKIQPKKTCLFNHNLSLSFRNKTVYNEILVYCLKICISIARVRN